MITFANIPETSKKRIVIIGAGFAGLLLARKIDKTIYYEFFYKTIVRET